MDSQGKISSWFAKLCGGVDTLCCDAEDMLPQEPIENVRNQFLTAGESLKQFYLNQARNVLPIFMRDSQKENAPTFPKQEDTCLQSDKSIISAVDGQKGISEAMKSLSHTFDSSPGSEVRLGLVPKEEGEVRIRRFDIDDLLVDDFKSYAFPILDSLFRGLSPEEIKNVAAAKLAALGQSSAVGSYDNIDDISASEISSEIPEYEVSDALAKLSAPVIGPYADRDTSEFKFSTEIKEYKVPSSGAIEYDACAKFSAPGQYLMFDPYKDIDTNSNILDSRFSTEIQEYEVSDDESSGAIQSILTDSMLLGRDLRAELIRLGFLGPDSGSIQSLHANSFDETEERVNSIEAECSTEKYTSTDDAVTSSDSTISARASCSDPTIFGNELLDKLLEDLVGPSSLASYSDISDYSGSAESPDCDTGFARSIEEQKLDDSIIHVDGNEFCSYSDFGADHFSYQETAESPCMGKKFLDHNSCKTTSPSSSHAETNQENAEVLQDKEWQRLDEDFSDSDWEIV